MTCLAVGICSSSSSHDSPFSSWTVRCMVMPKRSRIVLVIARFSLNTVSTPSAFRLASSLRPMPQTDETGSVSNTASISS